MSVSSLVLLRQQPAPEIAVRSLLAVNLYVQPTLLKIGDLNRGELERAADAATGAVGPRDGEVEYVRSANPPGGTLVNLGDRRRRPEPLEGAGDRQLGAGQHGGDRSRPGDRRLHRDVDWHGGQSGFKGFWLLSGQRRRARQRETREYEPYPVTHRGRSCVG